MPPGCIYRNIVPARRRPYQAYLIGSRVLDDEQVLAALRASPRAGPLERRRKLMMRAAVASHAVGAAGAAGAIFLTGLDRGNISALDAVALTVGGLGLIGALVAVLQLHGAADATRAEAVEAYNSEQRARGVCRDE
jgi:hypothetical protein